jgi:hypothetical protein
VSAKGEGSTGRSPGVTLGGGRRVHQLARPRSNAWLWVLNAVVIGFVIIAAFLASTKIGHTVAAASYHFALYYMGVLALIALTAEVGIGLVCTDRIFMRPAGRVTMQAIHRATGFGAIAFLISHIILEIMAQRSTVLDAIIPFLYPSGSKSFYLGLGTLASDMFIFIMVIGVYRARLATRMSPAAWRVLHASAYVAWIFGLVHGLLAGRPAKAFFGYEGFVYWSYGFCVVAVALALVVRFVARDRARNELSDQVVAEPPPGASLSSAAAITSMGMSGGAMTALGGGPHSAGALEGGRPGATARGGRPQLALPAGKSSASGRTGQFTATGRLGQTTVGQASVGQTGMGQTARFGRSGGFDQFGPDHPSGPLPQVDQFGQQFGADHPSGPLPQVGRPLRNQPAVPSGQRDWHAAYERPMGVRRPDAPAPRYEQTGEIDQSGGYPQQHPSGAYQQQHPSGAYQQQRPPEYEQRGPAPRYEHPSGGYPQQHPSGAYPQQQPSGAYQQQRPSGAYQQQHPSGAYQQQRPPEYEQRGLAPRYEHPSGGYPQQQPSSGYQQQRPSGGYPQQPPDYEQRGPVPRYEHPSGGYPQQRPPEYEQRGPAPRYDRPAGYDRSGQYGPPAGYDRSGSYPSPAQYEPPMSYDMAAPPASRPYPGPPQADPRYGSGAYPPAPGYGQAAPQYQAPVAHDPRDQYTRPGAYDRAAQFERERAEHYASFAEQDASYTRPRPPAARGHYNPQDETDPLNTSAVNTGYRQ